MLPGLRLAQGCPASAQRIWECLSLGALPVVNASLKVTGVWCDDDHAIPTPPTPPPPPLPVKGRQQRFRDGNKSQTSSLCASI